MGNPIIRTLLEDFYSLRAFMPRVPLMTFFCKRHFTNIQIHCCALVSFYVWLEDAKSYQYECISDLKYST